MEPAQRTYTVESVLPWGPQSGHSKAEAGRGLSGLGRGSGQWLFNGQEFWSCKVKSPGDWAHNDSSALQCSTLKYGQDSTFYVNIRFITGYKN